MQLTRRRPADDVVAVVPHQRAGVLDARLGRGPGQPRAAARLLGEQLHRRRPTLRRDRVQRHRRDARDPDAPTASDPTTPTTRLRRCYTGPSPDRERQLEAIEAPLRLRDRVRVRPVGVAVRADLAARHAARSARSERPASTRARSRERRSRPSTTVGRRPARSASSSCATRRSCAATTRCPTRPRRCSSTAGCAPATSCSDERRRHVHVRRPQEGSDPPPGREPVADRGRGRARAASRRRRGRGDRRALRSLRGGREGVRGRRRRDGAIDLVALHAFARERLAALQGAALLRGGRRAAAHARPVGWPSTAFPWSARAEELDMREQRARSDDPV